MVEAPIHYKGHMAKKQTKKPLKISGLKFLRGAGGNRTRVQTYPPKAFYMLICALGCRDSAGAQQTNLVLIR